MKPTDVVATVMDLDKGLMNVVAGQVASERMARFAVALLKSTDDEAYATWKALKYPGTTHSQRGVATPETKKKALAFALARACEITLAHHYRVE